MDVANGPDATVSIALPQVFIEAVARRAAEIVLDQLDQRHQATSPYLTVKEAAAHLRCSRQRVYDLLSSGQLSRKKDGARVLVSRTEIEEHLDGGASSAVRSGRQRQAGGHRANGPAPAQGG